MLQKNAFGQKKFWISLAKLKNCQNDSFEPVHEIQFFGQKHSYEASWKMASRMNIHKLSQGPQNPGFMQEKVQKGDFLKKDSRELNCFFLVLGSYESPEGLER